MLNSTVLDWAWLHAGGRALSVSGLVRRTPSPGCPMAPLLCVLNNKHPCNPKPVCCGIAKTARFQMTACMCRVDRTAKDRGSGLPGPDPLTQQHQRQLNYQVDG
jgi:hypothetical protein